LRSGLVGKGYADRSCKKNYESLSGCAGNSVYSGEEVTKVVWNIQRKVMFARRRIMRRILLSLGILAALSASYAYGHGGGHGGGSGGGHPGMRGPVGMGRMAGSSGYRSAAMPARAGLGQASRSARASVAARKGTLSTRNGRGPVASSRGSRGKPGHPHPHPHHPHHPHNPGGYIPGGVLPVPVDNGVIDGVAVGGAEEAEDGGVLIRSVTRGGVAHQAGLQAGDVIVSFGGVRTRSFEELQAAVQEADGPVKVVFVNSENGQTEYLTLEPEDGRIGVTCE
jgi:hypothetical protein